MDSINQTGVQFNTSAVAPQKNIGTTKASQGVQTTAAVVPNSPVDGVSIDPNAETIGTGRGVDVTYNTKFPDKKIVLTFDDGPNPKVTPKILKTLRQQGIKGAVFFVLGENAEKYPDLVKQIVNEGHFVGNHTYSHANLSKLSPSQRMKELTKGENAIKKALGNDKHINIVRPPYGSANKSALDTIHNTYGANSILWNFDTEDWKFQGKGKADGIVKNTVNSMAGTKKGGVMLMHDINPNTAIALPKVINKLKAKGYQFVSFGDV